VINQSAIRGSKHSLLAGLDDGVAYECLDACNGGNLQLARIVYQLPLLSNPLQSAWIVYQWMYVIKLIAISLDCVLMDVDSVFNNRFNIEFNGWFNGWFDLAVLGYQPQQTVQLLRQESKQTRCLKLVLPASLNERIVLRALKAIIIVT
jgi:hypothetical protein